MSSPQTWDVRARFVALNPPFQGRSFPIVLFPAVIGRGTECEVFLDAVSISRQHAVVEEKDGRFHIRDLGSRNGIKLADQPVHEAVLNAGDVVTVGDIQLRFEPVSAGEAGRRESPGGCGPDIDRAGHRLARAVRAAGGPRRRDRGREGAPESQPRVGLNLKMVAVVVAALAAFGGRRRLHPPLLRPRGGRSAERNGPPSWSRSARRSGSRSRACSTSRSGPTSGGRRRTWATAISGKSSWAIRRDRRIRRAAATTAIRSPSVEKYDPGEILVTGKSVGETGVTITLDNGSILTMRVIVRGRLEDPLDPLLYGRYSAPERVAMAEQFLDNGILIEKEKPYLALQEYLKARAVLTPLPDRHKGDLYYLQIGPRLAKVQRTVDDRWNELRGKISVAAASNDLTTAMDLLQEAVKLIPDPNDPRHQKAQGALRALIRRQLEERQ